MNAAEKRRKEFLVDLYAVCRKHRVNPDSVLVTLNSAEIEKICPNKTTYKEEQC